MPDIRISALPLATGPTAPATTDVVAIDGATTRKAPLSSLADVVRPMASQAEAEAGTNAVKGMSPLTTAQAIDAQAASTAQGAKADTALQPSAIGTTVASIAQGAKADTAMQPTVYEQLSVGGDAFDLSKTHGYYPLTLALASEARPPLVSPETSIINDTTLDHTDALLMQAPAISGARGFQGVCWVPELGYFISAWNRANVTPADTERINLVVHDRFGSVISYSATLGPGSSNVGIDLGHGQTLDYKPINGVITLFSTTTDGRGVSICELPADISSNNWLPLNYKAYTLQPAGVTAGTVALSFDKNILIKTGGPYLGGKNIRICRLSDLLALPAGDYSNQVGTLLDERMQPSNPYANQGITFDGQYVIMLNGNNLTTLPKNLIYIRWADGTVVGTYDVTPGLKLAIGQSGGTGDTYEPEGMFWVVPGPGAKPQLWMGMGTRDFAGTGWAMFVLPIFQSDIGAVSANGNRSPLGGGVNFAGGSLKAFWPVDEAWTWGVKQTTAAAATVRKLVAQVKSFAGENLKFSVFNESTGTETQVYNIDRSTGKMSFDIAPDVSQVGTWTPTLSFGGGTTGLAYTTQSGRYVKNGRHVSAWCRITLSAKGSSTGNVSLGALPFTTANSPNSRGNVSVSLYSNMASLTQGIFGLVGSNATVADLRTGGAASSTVLTDANFTNTSDLILQFSYEAAS